MSDTAATGRSADVRRMTFDDNALLPVLYGNHDRHLVRIEQLAMDRDKKTSLTGLPRIVSDVSNHRARVPG